MRNGPKPWSEMTISSVSLSPALRHRLADQVVHAAVEVVDHVAAGEHVAGRAGPGALGSMSRQNVCWRRSVPSKTQATRPRGTLSSASKNIASRSSVHVEALLDELVVVQDVLVQGPGVLGQAERGERALLLGQVDRNRPPGSRPASPAARGRC